MGLMGRWRGLGVVGRRRSRVLGGSLADVSELRVLSNVTLSAILEAVSADFSQNVSLVAGETFRCGLIWSSFKCHSLCNPKGSINHLHAKCIADYRRDFQMSFLSFRNL